VIHVDLQPEPVMFNELVRIPGQKFLSAHPTPTAKEIDNHPFWTKIYPDLWKAYSGICSYCCHYIMLDTGGRSVEHFRPKARYPNEAYEWSNYRLVGSFINIKKRTREIIDPFDNIDGWFIILFPSALVSPHPSLDEDIKKKVLTTIEVIGLNDPGSCLHSRQGYIDDYVRGKITFDYLEEKAPFLGRELIRQGLKDKIKEMWSNPIPALRSRKVQGVYK